MTSSALFGSSSGPKPVLEFRAGKCTIKSAGPGEPDNKKLIQPDPRKGSIYIQRTDDGIVHLYWKPRSSHNPEDDLYIFILFVIYENFYSVCISISIFTIFYL